MSKGVKKIKYVSGPALYRPDYSKYNVYKESNQLILEPNKEVTFQISEWLPDTTKEEKNHPVTWILQKAKNREIISKTVGESKEKFAISLSKNLCGSYWYYLEASLFGKVDTKYKTGMYICGYCESKIISSKWSTQRGGQDIKNRNKRNFICYGHHIHLHLETEGLNGSSVVIEVWNRKYQDLRTERRPLDKLIFTYNNVIVEGGEINLFIRSTYKWKKEVNKLSDIEEFFIKVKDSKSKTYVKDKFNEANHALCLNIKNKDASKTSNTPINETPLKVHKPDVSLVSYQLCKFDEISLSELIDKKLKTSVLFKQGKTNGTATIVYETIAKGSNNDITIEVKGWEKKSCFHTNGHSKNIKVHSFYGQNYNKETTLKFPIYSTLSFVNISPLQYIWPIFNLLKREDSANLYFVNINSCAYFPNELKESILIKAYPDIKWTLEFKWNHTQPLVYRYGIKLHPHYLKEGRDKVFGSEMDREWSKKFGEMAQSFDLALQAEWTTKGGFKHTQEFDKEWAERIAKTLRIINKIRSMTEKVSNSPLAKGKIMFEIKPPEIALSARWYLEKMSSGNSEVTTMVEIGVSSSPLIEADLKINIFQIFRESGPAAICFGAGKVIQWVLEKLTSAEIDFLFMFTGGIHVDGKTTINVLYPKETIGEVKATGKIKGTIEFKAKAKGEYAYIKVDGKVKANATTSLNGGFKVGADKKGLYVSPVANFDGIAAKVIAAGTFKFGTYKKSLEYESPLWTLVEDGKIDFNKHYLNS